MLHVPRYPWSVAFGNRFYFRYMGEAGISEASGIIDFFLLSRTLDNHFQPLAVALFQPRGCGSFQPPGPRTNLLRGWGLRCECQKRVSTTDRCGGSKECDRRPDRREEDVWLFSLKQSTV
jgi:hypothetical protein